jgi:von Willebrand factor type A C-terminal domain
MPGAIRQALLLTDGQNDGSDAERLDQLLRTCEGQFQCDCRGVGTDWRVKQLQQIGSALLGTTDIIPSPELMVTDFQTILAKAMGKAISDVTLRLWTPQGATVRFCKEVSPEIVDLTDRAKSPKAQTLDYPTGAWGRQESRDFHFCIDVPAGNVGDEMLAGRASLMTTSGGAETKIAEARILALWTDDEARSTKINRRVAHYTGQAELATTIQEGLDARQRGDEEVATAKLGKAVKIAHDSGNEATAKLLRAVVEVEDAPTGTVRLKRGIAKEDEMALETRSTKTTRIAKS